MKVVTGALAALVGDDREVDPPGRIEHACVAAMFGAMAERACSARRANTTCARYSAARSAQRNGRRASG